MKSILLIAGCCSIFVCASQVSKEEQKPKPTYYVKPFPGFVPDSATAESLAKILVPRLIGPEFAKWFYHARKSGPDWIVTASQFGPAAPIKEAHSDGEVMNDGWQPTLTIKLVTGSVRKFEWK
jgi:hypothetical protein